MTVKRCELFQKWRGVHSLNPKKGSRRKNIELFKKKKSNRFNEFKYIREIIWVHRKAETHTVKERLAVWCVFAEKS